MKKIWFLFFGLISLLATSQEINHTDASGRRQGLWKKQYPNGKTMYEGSFRDNQPVGQWKRYHESGQLKALLIYPETGDSVQAQLFDTSGKQIARGVYTDEKKAGNWLYFSEGKKIAEENYTAGSKNGLSRKFYPTGELLEETEWKNDLRDGKYRTFFKNGKPYLECLYRNHARNGYCISYFPTGIPEVEAFYQDDLPEGEWKFFRENGELNYTLQYRQGVLLNPEVLRKLDTQQLNDWEKNRDKLTDPEKFLSDPTDFFQEKQQKGFSGR